MENKKELYTREWVVVGLVGAIMAVVVSISWISSHRVESRMAALQEAPQERGK